jgi:hypothetical protein
VQVLREQASVLTERAGAALRGKVVTTADGKTVVHDFDVYVPALDYTVTIVVVKHTITRMYPAQVLIAAGAPVNTIGMANNDQTLKAALRKAFASDRVTKLLGTLLAQVTRT